MYSINDMPQIPDALLENANLSSAAIDVKQVIDDHYSSVLAGLQELPDFENRGSFGYAILDPESELFDAFGRKPRSYTPEFAEQVLGAVMLTGGEGEQRRGYTGNAIGKIVWLFLNDNETDTMGLYDEREASNPPAGTIGTQKDQTEDLRVGVYPHGGASMQVTESGLWIAGGFSGAQQKDDRLAVQTLLHGVESALSE